MEREGPYIQFSPDAIQSWSAHTGLDDLDEEEIEATYQLNVTPFLMVQKDLLLAKYGWTEAPKADDELFRLWPKDVDHDDYLALPSRFSSFFSSTYILDDARWEAIFSNRIFEAKQDGKDNSTLHIATPYCPPVADMFYCLQLLAPGMLLIVNSEVTDDGERMVLRGLPSSEWIKDHHAELVDMMGEDRLARSSDAADDQNKAFETEWKPSYNDWGVVIDEDSSDNDCDVPEDVEKPENQIVREFETQLHWWSHPNHDYSEWGAYAGEGSDDSDDNRDYTACGQECGYCGHCSY